MDGSEEVITVLKEIRAEAHQTNVRLESIEGCVDSLERRISTGLAEFKDGLKELGTKQVEVEMRVATEIVSVAMLMREVRDLLQEERSS